MCSNYELHGTPRNVMLAFGLDDEPSMPNKDELRPTDLALVIGTGKNVLLQPWGLSVDWSKQPMINARSETLREKPTFNGLLEKRCVVPASAYFEWRKTDGGRKLKNRISVAGADIFAMAGLTDGERFTIVTCAPSPSIAHIHNRHAGFAGARRHRRMVERANPMPTLQGFCRRLKGDLAFEEETPPPPAQADLFG